MTAPTPKLRPHSYSPVSFIKQLWRTHAPLTLMSLTMALLTVFFIVGVFADSTVITGAPAWLKPAKFGISIALYTLTITWLLGFVRAERVRTKRLVNAIGWITVGVFVVEIVPIVLQVLRGTTSHFNVGAPLDAFMFWVMGIGVTVLWFTNFVLAVLLLRQRFESPAFGWAIRLGLIIAMIGMAEGFLMTSPTAQQLASWQAGAPVTIAGAHSVGVPDGGPGLPVVNWSTTGGDLRVGHFVGMHALQVLPFVGWFVTRRRRFASRLTKKKQTALVWTAGGFYLGLTLLLTWQALRAQPLIQPDALTLSVFAVLSAAALLATFIIYGRSRVEARVSNG